MRRFVEIIKAVAQTMAVGNLGQRGESGYDQRNFAGSIACGAVPCYCNRPGIRAVTGAAIVESSGKIIRPNHLARPKRSSQLDPSQNREA
jgi:hypothetical protein